MYPALNVIDVATLRPASSPEHYQVRGDRVGLVAITAINVVNNPVAAGQLATATVQLVFAAPLPDDRYTLTIFDSLTDPAGNALDGETNADEPQENPTFPSGDGISGGDFAARFTVDCAARDRRPTFRSRSTSTSTATSSGTRPPRRAATPRTST